MMETNTPPPPSTTHTSGGHIMQSRTTSTSHGLRSRSTGRRGRRYTQVNNDEQMVRGDRSKPNHASNNVNSEVNGRRNSQQELTQINPEIMDENGRCLRHPGIELCRREYNVWKVLLQDCPLCSMAVGGAYNHNTNINTNDGNSNNGNLAGRRKGAESSLKTDTTSPMSEEDENKSWTLSDASSSEGEGRLRGAVKQSLHQPQQNNQQQHANSQQGLQQNIQHGQQQQQHGQPPPPPRSKRHTSRSKRYNNQVASLKELGKKLAAENNSSAAATSSVGGDDLSSMGGMTAASKRSGRHPHLQAQQQMQGQHGAGQGGQVPPPPPRRITGDLRNLSTKELSELRRTRRAAAAVTGSVGNTVGGGGGGGGGGTRNSQIDEANDLISRMSLMNPGAAGSVGTNNNATTSSASIAAAGAETKEKRSKKSSRRSKQREETQAILGAAAEARARVLGRRSLLHEKDTEIPYNDDNLSRSDLGPRSDLANSSASLRSDIGNSVRSRMGSDGMVVDDTVREAMRGRVRGNTSGREDDILGAAEEIRNRAKRSLSRSRERNKAASIFCGETPTDYPDEQSSGWNDGDETVATSASKRSILNPHGLSVAPQAPAVERRSQSRGKERGYAPAEHYDDDYRHNASPSPTERKARINRRGSVESNVSSAQALINRRREMRERIAERQNNIEKRHNRSINELEGSEKVAVDHLADEMLNEWEEVSDVRSRRMGRDKRDSERRRGRSRSVVRDGLSKIRSASLTAFRKGSGRSVSGYRDDDGNTVDTGKKSQGSSTSFLGRVVKKTGRSLSRSRSVASEYDARSDCRSDSFALSAGGAFNDDDDKSSRSGIMRRFSIKNKSNGRSSSRGSFRSSGGKNSFHQETQSENIHLHSQSVWTNDGEEERFSRSNLARRLSQKNKSLSRNNSIGDGLNEFNTTRSENFATNNRDSWFEEDELIHGRLSKRSPERPNPFY